MAKSVCQGQTSDEVSYLLFVNTGKIPQLQLNSQVHVCVPKAANVIEIYPAIVYQRIEEHFSKTHSVHFLTFLSYDYHDIPYMHIYNILLQTVPKFTQKHEIN